MKNIYFPEIMPDRAKRAGAAVVCTGRSDFPNQINNVAAFPGIFRGALDVNASLILIYLSTLLFDVLFTLNYLRRMEFIFYSGSVLDTALHCQSRILPFIIEDYNLT